MAQNAPALAPVLQPSDVVGVRAWMFEAALPLWADIGLDRRHGGAVESLTLEAAGDAGAGFKRTRVICRQLYVFCHAHLLGWEGARTCADFIYAELRARYWRGAEIGWARRLTALGAPLDDTPDLYDYAFCMFALAWRVRAFQDESALALAHATLDILETRFAHPGGLGFHAALPPALPREQNPHMHLTEAALALFEASGDQRFAALADRMTDLMRAQFLKGAILPEFFDDDWRPLPGAQGARVEPGHMFEWAWILAQHHRLRGGGHAETIAALVDFAERHGVDPVRQITFNAVTADGAQLDCGSRVWPNTERLKGWIGAYEVCGLDPRGAIAGSIRALFVHYLNPAPRGAWIDAIDAEAMPIAQTIPASTLYHLFLAFAEVLRVAPRLV
jgi:mannose/cellobiose epimerase-like protein (N-acyl-D-glucosamine 2-epimerase family)